MTRALYLSTISLVLVLVLVLVCAGAAACASNEAPEAGPPGDADGGPIVGQEGGAGDAGDAGAATDATPCSPAGWCPTPLPDIDLTFKDIWPTPGHAFAVAESPTVGAKVLEWRESEGRWFYIDDGTQNQIGYGKYVGKLWSPGEDEVYFTVAPRSVYHGKRTGGPSGSWAWTRQQLESRIPTTYPATPLNADHYTGRPTDVATAETLVSLGVFGSGSDDVYAWYGNAIYRATFDGSGDPSWTVDYVADDLDRPDEQLFFLGATGTGRDDLWFSGGRGGKVYDYRACAMAVQKTATGYRRVVDATSPSSGACDPRPSGDAVVVGGDATGWLTDIRSAAPNVVVGLKGALSVASVSTAGAAPTVSVSAIPYLAPPVSKQFMFLSIAAASADSVWLGGFSLVAQGNDLWNPDGGTYAISTISLNGSFTSMPVYQIRMSSNHDVWAVGGRYALHKTTP